MFVQPTCHFQALHPGTVSNSLGGGASHAGASSPEIYGFCHLYRTCMQHGQQGTTAEWIRHEHAQDQNFWAAAAPDRLLVCSHASPLFLSLFVSDFVCNTRGISTACLELGQHWLDLLIWHGPEGGAFHGCAISKHDAALLCNVLGSVDVVSSDHAHSDASSLAYCHSIWNLLPDRVLQVNPSIHGCFLEAADSSSRSLLACFQSALSKAVQMGFRLTKG